MQLVGILIFFVIIYISYQVGRIKGKAEMFFERNTKTKSPTDKIEEAEYEEIK